MRVSAGSLVCGPPPHYPLAPLRAHLEGRSEILVHVAKDGHVDGAQLARPSGASLLHADLDFAALSAARQRCHTQEENADDTGDRSRVLGMTWVWTLESFKLLEPASQVSLESLEKLADAGDAQASWQVYQRMPLAGPHLADVVRRLQAAAEGGIAEAQFELGRQYRDGIFVQPDRARAKVWWERARRAGGDIGVRAMTELATLLLARDAPDRDAERALALLRQAVKNPRANDAMLILGDTYHAGHDVPRNEGEALAWWRRAGVAGAARGASVRLGDAYRDGTGVPVDRTRAMAHYLYGQDYASSTATTRLAALAATPDEMAKAQALRQAWGDSDAPWQGH